MDDQSSISKAWQALAAHFSQISNLNIKDQFDSDPQRFSEFSLEAAGIFLDYSKNKVTKETMSLLFDLAKVSQVAKQLDVEVAACHRRPLKDQYRVLMFDGVVLARKTGAGAIKRPVLVAWASAPTPGRKSSISAWCQANRGPPGKLS